ncbi:SIR2 family protein [Geodermatophilus sp. CPCC 205506]|uniref:SIR2 family protein n=1 Tax=Geodermatophilus sp. CPCC 205506 TaxID=2936596 RepID=UPI003EEB0ABA
MNWDHLKETYVKHGIVVVLGAGVSVGSGLPTWSGLLERIADRVEDEGGTDFVRELQSCHVPLQVIASVLEERCGDREEFVAIVREALYSEFPFFPGPINHDVRAELVQHVQLNNVTLQAVASLCAMRDSEHARYSPNPQVHAVVTSNLDNVLQEYVRGRYGVSLLRTIDRASAQAIVGRTNVYHMHGFTRFDPKAADPAKNAPDAVVLTEQDYYDFFGSPTSLFNYTFLYLLREWSFLFIGSSMQDENIRRLLHVSKLERVHGHQNERKLEPDEIRRQVQRHFAILKHSSVPRVDDAVEASLRPLGTSVVWINDHKELKPKLQELYEAAGLSWELVF